MKLQIEKLALGFFICLFLVYPLFQIIRRDLNSPNFWFDESGQYWLARGQHHFKTALHPDGGWPEILEYGRVFNCDPGGFTLILRVWIEIAGSSPLALRLLPFSFFLGMITVFYLAARGLGAPREWAVLASGIPITSPLLIHYSTELRAYSMEACAVALLCFSPIWISQTKIPWGPISLGTFSALLASSRYSAFLIAAAASFVSIFPLRPRKVALARFVQFSLPLAFMVMATFFLFAVHQNGGALGPPAYVKDFLLSGQSWNEIWSMIKKNTFSPEVISIVLFISFPLLVLLQKKPSLLLQALLPRLIAVLSIAFCLTMAASFVGKLPWAVNTRWSIGYHALAACSWASLLAVMGTLLDRLKKQKVWLAKILLIATGIIIWNLQQIAFKKGRPTNESIASVLRIADQKSVHSLFIGDNAVPSARYLLEAGPLRGSSIVYPDKVYFETHADLNKRTAISAKKYQGIVVPSASTLPIYEKRIVGRILEIIPCPDGPSFLVLIMPSGRGK